MSISIIIPTLNEAGTIATLVRGITEHATTVSEIIVVDAGSTDDTVPKALQAGATVFSSPVQSRAAQMNLGARKAKGDILYFVHADVRLLPDFCTHIGLTIEAGFEAGCFRSCFDSSAPLLKLNAFFTRYNRMMCRGGDQTLFITKKLFDALNGFNEFYTIMEDYDLVKRICSQAKFKVIPRNVIVSARKYQTNSWLRIQLVNATAFMLFNLKVHPQRIRAFYKKALKYR
jgi:rSAM/selenodomain-associated transferase 2